MLQKLIKAAALQLLLLPLSSSCPTTLLLTNQFINQGQSLVRDDLVLVQQFGGNLQIYKGELGNLECLVWESGVSDIPSDDAQYFSILQGDANFVTRKIPNDSNIAPSVPFKSGPVINGFDQYFLIVSCDGTVGIYDSEDPGATPIWSVAGEDCSLTVPVTPAPTPAPINPVTPAPTLAATPPPTPAPTNAATPAPTRSPENSTCQPVVLLSENQRVTSNTGPVEGNGAYIEQLSTGNVRVRRGSSSSPGEVLWQSCQEGPVVDVYFTALQADSNFLTRRPSNNSIVWKRDSFSTSNANGVWELVLRCDSNTNDYGSLQIRDSKSSSVKWTAPLNEECNLDGVTGRCPNAALLLDMNERIFGGTIKGVSSTEQEYSLEQENDGNLVLWKGLPNSLECQLWDSGTQFNPNNQVYTVMQNDGNLVTYLSETPGAPFDDIWDSGTDVGQGTYHFVVDVCTFDQDAVAIYEGDPITEQNAELIGWALFNDCQGTNTQRRDRKRRLRSPQSMNNTLAQVKGPSFMLA